MLLGTCSDGRGLAYDEARCAFRVGPDAATLAQVRALDAAGRIRWNAMEQRDWLRAIDADVFEARAREAADGRRNQPRTAHEQVLADAARDDSILAGSLVDASPALVQAVADALEERGLLAAAPAPAAPLAAMDLPDGLEALAQLERARAADPSAPRRPATSAERRLARKILRNDDRAKAKREKSAARAAAAEGKEA